MNKFRDVLSPCSKLRRPKKRKGVAGPFGKREKGINLVVLKLYFGRGRKGIRRLINA